MEQLRASYAIQVERFRDYRAAQMETMGQHLDNIRDNYNQQVCESVKAIIAAFVPYRIDCCLL